MMIKKLLMIGSLAAIFLFSGCDSSAESVESAVTEVGDNVLNAPKRAYIVINNLTEEICTDRFIQDEMQERIDNMEGVDNLTITSEPTAVNCSTYQRINSDEDLCREFDARTMNTVESCVITVNMERDAINEGKYQDFIDIIMDQYL